MSSLAHDVTGPFSLQRLGVVMEPQFGNPQEAWGVLNPGAARDRSGILYLFPRLVAEGNYSRIGLARVRHDVAGNPTGVERLGIVLEPQEPAEMNAQTGGGVEDPRITFVQPLDTYVMAYTAFGPLGPRVALATSRDLLHWTRLGLVHFDPRDNLDLNVYDNKDASFFPDVVVDPRGRPALAMLHRPAPNSSAVSLSAVQHHRASIWISFVPLELARADLSALTELHDHTALATPVQAWESLKIGAGPPPVSTPLGWLVVYHGVAGQEVANVQFQPYVQYSAGVLVLDPANPLRIIYRSQLPILAPEEEGERSGIVPNVVFPTGLDPRGDNQFDVYYGMADSRIGAARLTLPAALPHDA